MNISALLTSAGINIAICVVLLSLYSILRKQPGNVGVYFARRLVQDHTKRDDPFWLERFVPSPSWIRKAWAITDEEILAIGGLDAVAFLRILVFSIRMFSIAALICVPLVLPLNYFGQHMIHKHISSESLGVFTIGNVRGGSKWLWAHCLALYIVSISACALLYFEYKSMARLRLAHYTKSAMNPSHFSVLVRSIPFEAEVSYSDVVKNFFTKYYASSYLSHQIVYRSGTVQKLMMDAEMVYDKLSDLACCSIDPNHEATSVRCGLCGRMSTSFKILSQTEGIEGKPDLGSSSSKSSLEQKTQECGAAFVFFKTRYDAVVASRVLQSSNPMLWVTDLAPEPNDVYWSNLSIPYRQLWIRKIATLLGSIVFMFIFILPVALVQSLAALDQLQQKLPFLKGILKNKYGNQLVTGYLPSVVLMLFLYTVPPLMMLFSAMEGSISRSGRKKSACVKVLYFTIWNVFFVNVLSGTLINQLKKFFIPKDIPTELAKAVPNQATFFITYVLTSGWASISTELMQPFALLCNLFMRFKHQRTLDWAMSFPYQTEVPKVLLFGLLGFTCAILAPLILPFLLIYFFLAYIVYRNQFLNVYVPKYETCGTIWPIVHNTTIFSLVLSQVIALGVFGLKLSPVASGFVIPLVVITLLFNQYCRQRFNPIFDNYSVQELIEMDRQDEVSGRMEEIHEQLKTAYCQLSSSEDKDKAEETHHHSQSSQDGERGVKPGLVTHPSLGRISLDSTRNVVNWVPMLTFNERTQHQLPK